MSIGSFLASAGRIGEGVEQYQTDSALRQLQRQQAIAAQDALAREAAVRRDLKMLPQLDPLDMPQLGAPMQLEQVPAQLEPMTTGADTGADTGGTTKTKTAGVTPPTGVVFKPFAIDGVSIKPWNTSRPDRLNAGFAGFERVDPNASDFEQYNARYRNDTKLGGILYKLSQSTVVPFQSVRSPFVSQKSKQDLETSQRASVWYQTNDAKDYFRRNPEMLAVAEKNPVNFFDALNKTNQRFSAAQAKVKAAPAGVREEPAFLAESRNLPAWQQITQGAESEGIPAPQSKMIGRFPESYKDPQYDWADQRAAEKIGVPVELINAVRLAGERTNAGKVSSAGAQTPYQFTPDTRAGMIKKYKIDPWASPLFAAEATALHLKESLDRGLSPEDALREYHGGPNRAAWGEENQKYAKRTRDFLAGKAVAGGATAPVPQLKNSDFYLAKEGAIGSDLALALRNRQEIARIATIYQQNGMVDQFLNLRYKLMETDSNLLYLQGMQAIQEISALRDPRRLESVYSAYLGSPVRFQPRSDGTWNVIANGNVVQAGMETGSLITAVRTGIDKQYLADRTKLSSEISMETFKSQLRRQEAAEQKTMEAAASIQKALIEGKVQLAKTIAENAGGKITAQGDNVYLQKDGQLYKIDPGGEQVPGAAAGLMTQPSARLVPVGASG